MASSPTHAHRCVIRLRQVCELSFTFSCSKLKVQLQTETIRRRHKQQEEEFISKRKYFSSLKPQKKIWQIWEGKSVSNIWAALADGLYLRTSSSDKLRVHWSTDWPPSWRDTQVNKHVCCCFCRADLRNQTRAAETNSLSPHPCCTSGIFGYNSFTCA